MIVVRPTAQAAALYRCDVCGRQGYWKSHAMSWSFFGPMEGDGLHICSDECRAAIPDPDKAFKKLFTVVDYGEYQGRWPERRHDGLITDKPPRSSPLHRG